MSTLTTLELEDLTCMYCTVEAHLFASKETLERVTGAVKGRAGQHDTTQSTAQR